MPELTPELIPVKLLKNVGPLNVGEIAGFTAEKVVELLKSGSIEVSPGLPSHPDGGVGDGAETEAGGGGAETESGEGGGDSIAGESYSGSSRRRR